MNDTNKDNSSQTVREINIWEKPELYKSASIEELLELIKNGTIIDVNIDKRFIPGDNVTSLLEKECNRKKIIINYTNSLHPITIPTNYVFGNASISMECFKKHEKAFKEAFLYFLDHTKQRSIHIPDYLFSQELLDILLEKDNISLYFNNINFTSEQLKQIHNKLIDVYLGRKQINSHYVIPYYTIDKVKENNHFSLKVDEIKNCMVERFNLINDNSTIEITDFSNNNEQDYLKEIFPFLEKLDQLNKHLYIKIDITKRSLLEEYLQKYHFQNIELQIKNDLYDYSYQEYMEEEKILNSLVEPIKKANLSPLEKYIAVYNIVKNFKPYKENEDDKSQSRYLRYILHNNYIVCVGYAKLFECLLDKVGINANTISVTVDASYDEGFNPNDPKTISVTQEGHARIVVDMEDDKYNIHGLYMADPTWDNDVDKDYLNHVLMTFDNMVIDKRMFFLSPDDPILNFHSFDEFSRQINYLLKHKIERLSINNNKYPFYKNQTEIILAAYNSVTESILNNIQCDERIKYFKDLLNNCKFEEDYENLLTELGHYLLVRINKPIDNKIVLQADKEAKKQIYGVNTNTAEKDTEEIDLIMFPYQIPDDESHNLTARNSSK